MAFKQLRETCFYKTGRDGVVLEFIDQLTPNKFTDNSYISSNIFGKYSNIRITIIDKRNKNKGGAVYYNLDPEEIILIAHLLSDGNITAFKNRVGYYSALTAPNKLLVKQFVGTFKNIDFRRFDSKIASRNPVQSTNIAFQKNIDTGNNNLLVRKIIISYEEAMRSSSKWKITIEEGTGQKNIQKSQGLNIVQNGTYKCSNKSYMMLQENELIIPLLESAKRVFLAEESFYVLMKKAQLEFTKEKKENNDYTGEKIDQWNPKGAKKEKNYNNSNNVNTNFSQNQLNSYNGSINQQQLNNYNNQNNRFGYL
ncbi:hypothetical protein N494_19180 (plasmid) [Clostridium botulinum A2B7 92]|uniref:hypothetical protein n=1 Tax=Clostridium botulinum TaxID=1491 RepID=UPI0007E0F8B9|nr:hypothetical protein [Clostridium botulinum]KEI94230.1 hypothetical protein N494_19180 [Clostridium botulinum A2B7 92]OSA73628.1 hypothetical protein B2H86_14880 [Clostridium botulinum]